jgi:hypothetical protein
MMDFQRWVFWAMIMIATLMLFSILWGGWNSNIVGANRSVWVKYS